MKKVFLSLFFIPILAFGQYASCSNPLPFMTNTEKRALPIGTALGTMVIISDAFSVTAGSSGVNVLWIRWVDLSGKHSYKKVTNFADLFMWDTASGGYWGIYDSTLGLCYTSSDDVAEPWLVSHWELSAGVYPVPMILYPAKQRLDIADPSVESHWTIIDN